MLTMRSSRIFSSDDAFNESKIENEAFFLPQMTYTCNAPAVIRYFCCDKGQMGSSHFLIIIANI